MREREFAQSDTSSREDFSFILDLDSDSSAIKSNRDLSTLERRARVEEDTHTEDAYDGNDGIVN